MSPREDSVLVRAGGPIEGIEFAPSWSSCVFRTGVRPPNNTDGPEIARPTVVASDSEPLDPIACATRYVAATVMHAARADTPAMAQQQGITGTVRVFVSLDERGSIISSRILSSPSAILNNAALATARASTYRGAVFRCKPIPSGYVFAVDLS
jgi:TonB family protein